MKERPIIFNGEMVRAILEGRKTQTRRVVKPQPELGKPWGTRATFPYWVVDPETMDLPSSLCPHGLPGDRLWVRETWSKDNQPQCLNYRASSHPSAGFKWSPSASMPRWASRIDLEITEVRVERVQEIDDTETLAEGVLDFEWIDPPAQGIGYPDRVKAARIPRQQFRRLWDSINAKRGFSWESNCWVWVVEFKRIKP